jgi:hypothetical protein
MKEGGEMAGGIISSPPRAEESPSQFYERYVRLSDYTPPFNLKATENQRMINAAFVGQAQGDIR